MTSVESNQNVEEAATTIAHEPKSKRMIWVIASLFAILIIFGVTVSGNVKGGLLKTQLQTSKFPIAKLSTVIAPSTLEIPLPTEEADELTPYVERGLGAPPTPPPTFYDCFAKGYPTLFQACCGVINRCLGECTYWYCTPAIDFCEIDIITCHPSHSPTAYPTNPTANPTPVPTAFPNANPSPNPTESPTAAPV